MSKQRVVVFDLDGTLADYSQGWQGIYKIGRPLTKGVKLAFKLANLGYRIIIYTCRTNPDLNTGYTQDQLVRIVKYWLDKYLVPYDEIYVGPGKPHASAYIDDRAVKFNANSNRVFALKQIEQLKR